MAGATIMMFTHSAKITIDGKELPDGYGIGVAYRENPRLMIYQSQHWHRQGAKLVVWLTRRAPGKNGKANSIYLRVREIDPEKHVVIREAGRRIEIKDRQATPVQTI